MFEREHHRDSAHREGRVATQQAPGKSSLVAQDDEPSYEWEDLAAEPPSLDEEADEASDEAEPAQAVAADASAPAAPEAAAPEASAPEAAAPGVAPAAATPLRSGPRGRYAGEHRKQIRDYPFKGKGPLVTNLAGREGRPDQRPRHEKYADGKISVDISTVIGGKPGKRGKPGDYRDGWILVWHTRKTKDKRRDPANPEKLFNEDNRSGDPTGWTRVGRLPKDARDEIAAFQDRVRAKARRNGKPVSGPGHAAPISTQTLAIAPKRPETITTKNAPRFDGKPGLLEPFRIRGGGVDPDTGEPTSTPLANYTHHAARYGDVVIGVWNPPGSSSGGKRNSGSGGIRTFLPLGTTVTLCEVSPLDITNYDTGVGTGTSKWIYVTTRVNGEPIFFWLLHSWTFTPKDKDTVTGSNF